VYGGREVSEQDQHLVALVEGRKDVTVGNGNVSRVGQHPSVV
jgi:hypothetical protein